MTWLAVVLGGALGTAARHGVNVVIARLAPTHAMPYATYLVNVSGCLVIGVLAGLVASGRLQIGTGGRAFLFVGVLGGYTTFSTFALDTVTLTRSGSTGTAAWNVGGQIVIGLLATYGGLLIGLSRRG